MQAAQIKYICFMPLSAREGNFFLVLSKGWFFWVAVEGFP